MNSSILFFGVWYVKSCFLDQRDKFCRSAAVCRQLDEKNMSEPEIVAKDEY